MSLYNLQKNDEANRIREQDRVNARQSLPYSGQSNTEIIRKQKISERQVFLEKASLAYPHQKGKDMYLSDGKSTFAIGQDNVNVKYLAKQQQDYKSSLDEQLDMKIRLQQEAKENARQDEARLFQQGLPYLNKHRDEE